MHKLDINQVYNGDSNLMIKSIESESVDLVIIDPPYKIRKKTDEINSLAKAVKKYNEELQRDNLINEYDSLINQNIIHTKGYMFDSLVYRFKDYQSRAFQAEVIDYKYTHSCSDLDAREKVKDRHNRDLMRFIQILDEAIGEHD